MVQEAIEKIGTDGQNHPDLVATRDNPQQAWLEYLARISTGDVSTEEAVQQESVLRETWDELDEATQIYVENVLKDPLRPVQLKNGIGVGHIYSVNGEGAVEHTTLVTQYEIESLCRHWAEELRSASWSWRVPEFFDGIYSRTRFYAGRRLAYFATILGAEKVEAIAREVFIGSDDA